MTRPISQVPRIRTLAVAGVCVLTAVLSASFVVGVSSQPRQAAASVGGVEYDSAELDEYLATLDPGNASAVPRHRAAQWLTRWVSFTTLKLMMDDLGVPVTNDHHAQAVKVLTDTDPAFVPGAAGGDVQIAQEALFIALDAWLSQEVPDPSEEVAAALGSTRVLCSRHILVASEADLEAALQRLEAGEEFADLAAELSIDQASGVRGGDLGCAPEGSFTPLFEEAAYAAQPGEIVAAATEFGFHVIQAGSSGPLTRADHPRLDPEVLAQLRSQIEAELLRSAWDRVDAERYGRFLELRDMAYERYDESIRIDGRYGVLGC